MVRWQSVLMVVVTAIGSGVVIWRARKRSSIDAVPRDRRAAVAARVAQRFVELLLARDYVAAHDLMSVELRNAFGIAQLEDRFERLVPRNWGRGMAGEAELVQRTWPDRVPGDVARYRVPIRGASYDERVLLVIAQEGVAYFVSSVEFGRG